MSALRSVYSLFSSCKYHKVGCSWGNHCLARNNFFFEFSSGFSELNSRKEILRITNRQFLTPHFRIRNVHETVREGQNITIFSNIRRLSANVLVVCYIINSIYLASLIHLSSTTCYIARGSKPILESSLSEKYVVSPTPAACVLCAQITESFDVHGLCWLECIKKIFLEKKKIHSNDIRKLLPLSLRGCTEDIRLQVHVHCYSGGVFCCENFSFILSLEI